MSSQPKPAWTKVLKYFLSSGVLILDDDSNTKFHRIIAAKEDALKASFVKIPTLFLQRKETEAFEELLTGSGGIKFLGRMSGETSYSSRIRGSPVA